ncbi:hypothetical protein ACJMK2_005130 [Sinanodonta woodiana]|uniref:BAR domain-containing protein n=1 Tax=Sinanodonta woodiana TaxID=1069815 RepID=A0ABD3VP46_SINWO
MSWNPFSRHAVSKKSVVSKAAEKELEREVKRLEELDEASRKLYKDMKRCVEANNALSKVEHKIVQDLSVSSLNQQEDEFRFHIEEWSHALDSLERYRMEMNSNAQRAVVEPMKKFCSIFPNLQSAIKKREQSLQEYNRCQVKVNKYQDRDRTGQNVVKLDMSRKALDLARDEFLMHDTALKQDLPKLYEGRIEYFESCLEALIKSQVSYNSETFKIYSNVFSQLSHNTNQTLEECKEHNKKLLTEIKGLSLTADD